MKKLGIASPLFFRLGRRRNLRMPRLIMASVLSACLFSCAEKSDEPAPLKQKADVSKPSEPGSKIASQGPAKGFAGDSHKVSIGKNVWVEIRGDQRRVLVAAYVCLREGQLEEFLCRRFTKEHESILAADIDARDVHQALILTGVEPGSPAEFEPVFKPARGPRIKVTVEYQKDGKTITAPAQEWLREIEKKKPMTADWVFAGSKLVPNPLEPDKPPTYLANSGDVISVSNFDCSLLDLAVRSSAENANLSYEAFTERIPVLETKVQVILEPVAAEKAKKK
jgi:hypothetical protein